MRRIVLALAGLIVIIGAGLASARYPPLRDVYRTAYLQLVALKDGIRIERNVMVTMHDGVRLATDLYLPDPREGLPTILVRLPYGKSTYSGALMWARRYATQGYALVLQDMRGRFGSEGTFTAYDHEAEDGSATIDWIAAQPWSNGKVATAGCSALGETQAILAKARNPHHAAMIAEAAGGATGTAGASRSYFGSFVGGIPSLAVTFGWFVLNGGKTSDAMSAPAVDLASAIRELPTGSMVARHRLDPTDYDAMLAHFEDPAFWDRMGYLAGDDRFTTPTLHVNTWQDPGLTGTFEIAALMRANADSPEARNNQPVVIGPGMHCAFDWAFRDGAVGDLAIDPDQALDYQETYKRWLDHWLRGGSEPALPPYTFYVLGADRWESSETWPPSAARPRTWYLNAAGALSEAAPPPATQNWRYDPMDPTPSLGGPLCCTGQSDLRVGPIDQSPNAGRADVLAFATAPLDAPLTVIGDLKAEITMSSDAPDTDLVAILIDIHPDGRQIPIQQGALRLRYRDGFDSPRLLPAGEPVTATVDLRQIAYEVAAGHRIGLHLSSSSFPWLERNLNTGRPNYSETEPRVAVNTIYFGGDRPSVLILPIVPDEQTAIVTQ